jgi:hypothetical protein
MSLLKNTINVHYVIYFVKVNFPNGLTTSANKVIPFRNGMTASGEIITEDKRLIERFLKEFMIAILAWIGLEQNLMV